ncbi:MAG: chemotaxis protein CheW [Candidatus Aquicultor sp.]
MDNKLEAVSEAIAKAGGDQFVAFILGEEEYGIEILRVQEIIGYRGFTRIPNVPRFIKGVLNLRGSVTPVIDLRLKLGMSEKPYDTFTVILILEVQERIIGAIVDAVSDVISLSEAEIQPAPDFSSGVRVDFIEGMGRKDDKLIILLDIKKVLGAAELEFLNAA